MTDKCTSNNIFHSVIIMWHCKLASPLPPPPTSLPSPSIIGGLFHCHCYQRSAKSTPNMHLSYAMHSRTTQRTLGTWVIPCQINAKKNDPSRFSSNFVSVSYLWSNSASPSFKLIRQVFLDLWSLKCHNFYDKLFQ